MHARFISLFSIILPLQKGRRSQPPTKIISYLHTNSSHPFIMHSKEHWEETNANRLFLATPTPYLLQYVLTISLGWVRGKSWCRT